MARERDVWFIGLQLASQQRRAGTTRRVASRFADPYFVSPSRIELLTPNLGNSCSIQLSYGNETRRIVTIAPRRNQACSRLLEVPSSFRVLAWAVELAARARYQRDIESEVACDRRDASPDKRGIRATCEHFLRRRIAAIAPDITPVAHELASN
jgi:hypothetical protein